MSSVAAQPGCCVLVLVVYLKIKKNKMMKQVAFQELCCVLLRESVMKHVAVHLVCCVFLRELFVKHVAVPELCCVFLLVPEV